MEIQHRFMLLLIFLSVNVKSTQHWSHSLFLSPDYQLLWTIDSTSQKIIFELHVKTLGYVTFGFLKDPNKLDGSDFVIGWVVNRGEVYLQDRHIKNLSNHSDLDASQDYQLLFGYKNTSHTVLRFRRRLNSCDNDDDVPITNNTMRIFWSFHSINDHPHLVDYSDILQNGRVQSVYLIQRADESFELNGDEMDVKIWELKNPTVLNFTAGTSYWCQIFKIPSKISRKHHLIRYEPLNNNAPAGFSVIGVQQIILYECQNNYSHNMEQLAKTAGRKCHESFSDIYNCKNLIANWAKGSMGFSFPLEVGYPLDKSISKYFLMETHYSSRNDSMAFDNSNGLRLFYTSHLRKYDAGVISLGINPSWRHIIPPDQHHVLSSGHCVPDCLRHTTGSGAISIFALLTKTHSIGNAVTLKHIRNTIELPPIISDGSVDSNYQEYRRLNVPVTILPGDHLISECSYNSLGRSTITLGGLTSREEICLVMGLYYPRRGKSLFICNSLPSLPTVLYSLGIEALSPNSNPVLIASPPKLAGMTLESRLISYDWHNQFRTFQHIMTKGSFKSICETLQMDMSLDTDKEHHYPNISKVWQPTADYICDNRQFNLSENVNSLSDNNNNRYIENIEVKNRDSNLHTKSLGLNIGFNLAKIECGKVVNLIQCLLIIWIM